MSDRKDAYTGQLVTQQFYDQCFDQVETADRNMTADSGFTGIYSGLGVSQHAGTPDLTVDVATGTAYAPGGERMRSAGLLRIDCSVDRDGISTTVTGNTHTRIISIIMRPDRELSDPQTDASNVTVYTQRTETFQMEVVQGAEADVPSAPAIPAGSTLLCDITITFGMTQILNASIAVTPSAARRQDAFLLTGSPFFTRSGKAKQAMQDMVTRYNNHVLGSIDQHDGGDVVYGGSGFWADGSTTVSAGPMDGAISEIVSDLASESTSDAGEQRIGCESDTSIGGNTLSASTLRARLRAIRLATNLFYAGGPAWADSSSGPAAGTVEAAIDTVVSTIAASTGAAKMGMAAVGNFTAGTMQAMIAQLAATTASNDGAKRIGTEAVGNFAGVTVRAQLNELTGTSSSNDGAKRIGTQTNGNLSGVTVRAQLDELDSEKGGLALANTWTQDQTFGGDIVFQSTNSSPEINQPILAGTGANAGKDLVWRAQPGQAQTGGANNNMGGNLRRFPGVAGTGGSGSEAYWGDDKLEFTNGDVEYTRFRLLDEAAASSETTIATVALSTSGMMATIEVTFHTKNSNGSGGSIVIMGTFRNISGTVTQQGSTTTVHSAHNNTGSNVTFDTATTNVKIQAFAGTAGGTTSDMTVFIKVTEFRFLPAS